MVNAVWKFIIPSSLLAALFYYLGANGSWFWQVPAVVLTLFTLFCCWFFRNPHRAVPGDNRFLVAPADGRIIAIEEVEDPWVGKAWEIRIFMNVFNMHVQRNPFINEATVEEVRYFAGKFLAADIPKASYENEQQWMRISDAAGRRVIVKQIAGLIARRIVSWVRPGTRVQGGQRIGLIQFGSQVDLLVPRSCEVLVRTGEKTVCGETLMVLWKNPETAARPKSGTAASAKKTKKAAKKTSRVTVKTEKTVKPAKKVKKAAKKTAERAAGRRKLS